MDEKHGVVEIDYKKLILFYLRRWWMIALTAIILAGGAYAYARYMVPVKYRASTTIFVNNFDDSSKYASVSGSGLSTNKQLVTTYIAILKSNRVLDKAEILLNGDYTAKQLSKMISADKVEDTEIMAVFVTASSATEAARVANVMGTVVMDEIAKIIDGSSARVLDTATVPSSRYSPSYRDYALKGGLIGVALALIVLAVVFLMDVRIKDEDDLAALIDAPILGRIPEFSAAEEDRSGRKKNAYDTTEKGEKEDDAGKEK